MSRKASSVVGLAAPAGDNRRMSMAKGLAPPSDSGRRLSNVTKPVSTGPSLVGLLASKRLAKRLTTRFFDKRGGRYGSRMSGQMQLNIQKEPSYRMEPHKKFCPTKVREVIAEVLEGRLGKFKYSPKLCANISKIVADEIKQKVKKLNYDRYKIVVQVQIGEKRDQTINASSRCVWDDHLDNSATYTFQNRYIFSTGMVFGVYSE